MRAEIEKQINKLLNQLKPEIKKRAVYRFSNAEKKEGKRIVLASTTNFNPPLITFYSKTIANEITITLKRVINHELIHTFTKSEREVYGKERKMNFFK